MELLRDTFAFLLLAALTYGDSSTECKPPAMQLLRAYGTINNNITKLDPLTKTEVASIDWTNIIEPAPKAIAVMSSLMLITAKRDVSLDDTPPPHGWEHVKWPNSLAATLLQVTHEGYRAMQAAHHNMNNIRLKTGAASSHFRDIVKLLTRGNKVERKHMLPISIKRLSEIAPECARMARETAKRFEDVSHLISELLEACKNTESLRQEDRRQAEQTREILLQVNETLHEHLQEVRQDVETAEAAMADAREVLKDAIKDKPDFWDYMGASVADFVGKLNPNALIRTLTGRSDSGESVPLEPSRSNEYGNLIATFAGLSGIFKTYFEAKYTQPLRISKALLEAADTERQDLIAQINELSVNFRTAQQKLGSLPGLASSNNAKLNALYERFSAIVNEGVEYTDQLSELAEGKLNLNIEYELGNTTEQLTVWQQSVITLQTNLTAMVQGTKEVAPIGPGEVRKVRQSSTAMSALSQNFATQVAAGQDLYAMEVEKYKFQVERLDRLNEQDREMIRDLASLDLTVVDLSEAIRVLTRAIHQLGLLQSQWNKIEFFFKQIESVINVQWFDQTTTLIELVKPYEHIEQSGPIAFGTDVLYRAAFKATRLNYRVHRVAATYVQVSQLHFMQPLQEMSLMVSLKTESELDAARQRIASQLDGAQVSIKNLVLQERDAVLAAMSEYNEQLHEAYEGLCPGGVDELFETQVQTAVAGQEASGGIDYDEFDDPGFDFLNGGFR